MRNYHRRNFPRKRKLDTLKSQFMAKTLKFTEKIIVYLSILYFLNWLVSVILICVAIFTTGNFAYLDTLITETGTAFRSIVGVAIIKFGVENIFKYNDFGGKITNKPVESEEVEDTIEDVPQEDIDFEFFNINQ